MAPRAYWKGYLKLSLVSCPIQLFPATSDREKIRFHQINRKTGNRIKYIKVDAVTGQPVDDEDIVKGYDIGSGRYLEITEDELEAIAIQGTHTIEIDQFVPKDEIGEIYWAVPYYIAPDGDVGRQAFSVIREAIKMERVVALGRVVFTTREHVIAIEPRGRAPWASRSAIPTRSATRSSISAILRTRKSPRTCSIWRSTSSGQRPGISSPTNLRITTRARSGS